MKRALSLIIVFAMVLCMIPFSAFAADFDLAGDFVDGVINLPADAEVSYLWTATEDGTLEIFADAVIPEVAEGEEAPAVAEPYILVDGAEYTEAVAVVAGQSVEITFGDDAMIGGEVNVYTIFKGLPGTETNPIMVQKPMSPMDPAPTITLEPGVVTYFDFAGFASDEVIITGAGVKVSKDGVTYGGEDATEVKLQFAANEMIGGLSIVNKTAETQTYVVTTTVKVGTIDNPEVVTDGTYTANLDAGNQGYFYSYIAEGDGNVIVTVDAADAEGNAIGWTYALNNLTTSIYGDTQWSDSDPVVNPGSIAVSAGDELQIMVNTYDPADWAAPAGVVTTTIELSAGEPTPEEPAAPIVIESLPYEATHSGVYEQMYNYTATENGYLYVASEGWMELNIGGSVWAEPYADGYILAMNAGDVANANVYAYWGENAFTYSFSWMTEVTPDGSPAFPFTAEIPSDGSVVTLGNDGEDAVYYAYTATEDCKIYNAFFEETIDVAAGETITIYVPAGGINVNYVLPVAIVDGVNYFDLQAAINAAALIGTADANVSVVMLCDYATTGAIIVPANVILDIAAFDLAASNLFVLNGGNIFSSSRYAGNVATCGTISVAKDSVVITATDAVVTNQTNRMSAMPIWIPESNCYVLVNARILDSTSSVYTLDKEAHTVNYVWKQSGHSSYTNLLKDNGGLDHGIRFCVKASWFTGTADVDLSFWYTDAMVKTVANGSWCTFGLSGLDILGANYAMNEAYDTFEVRACFITDCGVGVYGFAK